MSPARRYAVPAVAQLCDHQHGFGLGRKGRQSTMRYGFIIPGGGVHDIVELAHEAEEAGWDGYFYWDGICIAGMGEMHDPWVVLAAVAMRTQRVHIGAVLTPLSRRRPWKVARETVTLDHLSGGRLVLPVGLGALDDGGFGKVGEPTDRKTRAELLDESLAILEGLWSGQPFSYQGRHYHLDEMTFLPPPVQRPRIPIWVVGAWPSARSMDRALRYDGLLPAKVNANPGGESAPVMPDDIREMRAYIAARRADMTGYDIVCEGETRGDDRARAAAVVAPYGEAGATWWMESMWSAGDDLARVRARIRSGPPRADG
jgi:alkanesulfonate monooxygenase SsuD/methylene tetrahydromethanopterin reductase-like flavin-dependent oxidoreductase (luciferase family)